MSQFYLQTYFNYYHPKIPNPVRTVSGTTLKLTHYMPNQTFPHFSAVILTHIMTAFLPVSFYCTYNALTASPSVPFHAKDNLTLLPRHPPISQSPPCSINEPPLLTTRLPKISLPLYQGLYHGISLPTPLTHQPQCQFATPSSIPIQQTHMPLQCYPSEIV